MERKIIYKENSEEYKAIKLLEKMTRNYSLDGEDLHYAIILYNLIINLSIKNQQLKEEVEAVNKGLRKVKERSINYKNRCFKLNKKIYELEEQLEDKKDYINKLQATKDKLNKWNYEYEKKQQEFIKYLEVEIEFFRSFNLESSSVCKDILDYYKKIIGGK
jgi:chromosome segregation ATPase